MRKIDCLIIYLGIIILFNCCKSNINNNINPVNPNATKEAQKLLHFIYDISGEYTLTGQHNYMGRLSIYTDSIYKITGKYPAIWGSDFGFADSTHDIDNIKYRPLIVPEIKKFHDMGSIITMTYHQANPLIGEPCQFREGVQSKLSDDQWGDLLTPGTDIYNSWKKQMDIIGKILLEVQDLNIPILFRPYHEMNGFWFWWGGRKGKEGFIALWKQLYHYYTDSLNINNLIWVWSPDKPWFGLTEYYPGDEYVDIIACDMYPAKDTNVVYRQEWYEQIDSLASVKPIAIGEHSIYFTDSILNNQPRWVWFMTWTDLGYLFNNKEDIIKIYNSEKTITLDEIKKNFSLKNKLKLH